MQTTNLYPFLMQPALHPKVWGGQRLHTLLRKALPTNEPYGESWEVHDTATIRNGALAGQKLGDLLPLYGGDILGTMNDPSLGVPLLLKFIDAADWLSIQVHPNDAQARELDNEPRGKTEAWYVVAAEPGSKLVIGVQPGTTRAEVARAIEENRLEGIAVYVDVQPGDVLFITPGTIHALGPGVLIYEIQQSSDLTYRLYDWGRMGLDGKPRALHIDKGVTVSRVESLPEIRHTADIYSPVVEIVQSDYFTTLLYRLHSDTLDMATNGATFHLLTCIEGEATVEGAGMTVRFGVGETVFVPASVGAYQLAGAGRVLRSSQV